MLAAARPITNPADGSSQKYRYGTALAAHQPGRPGSIFLIARTLKVVARTAADGAGGTTTVHRRPKPHA